MNLASKLFWFLPLYAICSMTAMAGMNLSFLALVLAWLTSFALSKKLETASLPRTSEFAIEWKSYQFWAWALFIACIISLVVAKVWPHLYAGHAPDVTVHGFLKIWYLVIPAILLSFYERICLGPEGLRFEWLKKVLIAWWWMTLALGVMAAIQFNIGWPLLQVIPTNPTHYHAILMFGHHLSTSSILIFPAFTALAVALGAYTRNRSLLRFELVAGLTGILILFLSYARTAWIAIPIGIVLLFVRYFNRRQLISSLLVFFTLIAAFSQTPAMKERIRNGMGISERLELWKANIDYFKQRPLTGIGWLKTQEMSEFYFKEISPDHYKDYFWGHAHSNLFEMLGGTGILGLLAFLGWSFFTLRLALRTRRYTIQAGDHYWADFAWGIFVALLLLHFNGLTNVTFWEGKVMHQQMFAVALLLMILRTTRERSRHSGNPASSPSS